MKGSGGEFLSILLIIIMLAMLGILLSTTLSESNKRKQIMLDEAELIRVKNTFLLVNRSLGQTWLLSTTQSVFKTADESMGCGFDFESFGLGQKYWYNYDPSNFKDSSCTGSDCTIDPRLPQEEKYNVGNPRICYPQKTHVEEMLTEKMKPYLDINTKFDLNNVDVNITGIKSVVNLTSERVLSNTTQRIIARIGNRVIYDDNTTNNNTVFSELSGIVDSARSAVRSALKFSNNLTNENKNDDYDYAMRYQDLYAGQLGYTPTQSNELYEEQLKGRIEGEFGFSLNAKVKTTFNTFEFIVPNNEQKNIWDVSGLQDPRLGLILHYDMSIKFIEGADADTTTCTPTIEYDYIITEKVQENEEWKFNENVNNLPDFFGDDFIFENSEIELLVKAMIDQESAWNPHAISECGAVGLMQLMPGTAKGNGITTTFENSNIVTCDNEYANRLRVAIVGLTDEQIIALDERFDPAKNIEAGVKYLKQLMETENFRYENRENLMKLAIASYNTGPGNVIIAMDIDPKSNIYEDIASRLHEQTQEYVQLVLANYVCYGGSMETGSGEYYFYDEKNDRFIKRPFVTEIKLQDYVPVIDCRENPYQVDYIARQFQWTEGKTDVLCCEFGTPGKQGVLIYTCDLDIPEIGDAKLSQGERVTCFQSDPPLVFQCGPNGFERI